MEIKDLILLMMMPILLVSIIFYTNSNPITGMVAVENQENNIIGTYSINPSFRTKADYDLNDYPSIRSELDNILKKCENTQNIGKCLQDNAPENWICPGAKPGSKDESLKILDDFINKFQKCAELKDDGVVCRISLDERDLTYLPTPQRIFEITLTDEGPRTKIELKQNKVLLRPPEYINFGNPIPLANSLMFYKKNNIVNFVEATGASFMDPSVNKIIDISEAKGIKFCAKTGKKIYAYDSSDNQVKLRDIVYKFAVTYPDLPPQPLKNVEAFDKPKADKSILLKWENSSENNVAKYRIYYAESSLNVFDKTATDDLKKNPKVIVKDIELEPSVNFEGALVTNECLFDYTSKKCGFSTSNEKDIPIENNKLYFSKSSNSYIYSLVLPNDNTNYDIGITAVGKANNEINNKDDSQKITVVKSMQSIDDLPPDSLGVIKVASQTFTIIKTPDKNIDGSALSDLKEYSVYYTKKQSLTQPQKGEIVNSIREGKFSQLVLLANVNAQNQFTIDLTQTDPQTGDIYFFVVVASDIAGNPKKDQFKVKEIGAIPAEVDI